MTFTVGLVSCGPLWHQRHTSGTGERTSPALLAQGCSMSGSTTLPRRRVAESTASPGSATRAKVVARHHPGTAAFPTV